MPHECEEIATSAGTTHLTVAGGGDTTVVYFPGTNFNAATSLGVLKELAGRARVVVADVPGQPGLSDGAPKLGSDRARGYGIWAGEVVVATRAPHINRLILVGHSLGAAVALAAPTTGVDAILLIDPAGVTKLRVSTAVLGSTLPWLLWPTRRRSKALMQHLTSPDRSPEPWLVEWMTLVARHTKPVGAPGPLPGSLLDPWRKIPRGVVSGEHDCFLPPGMLAPPVRERLGVELGVLPGLGHLSVLDDPALVSALVQAAVE